MNWWLEWAKIIVPAVVVGAPVYWQQRQKSKEVKAALEVRAADLKAAMEERANALARTVLETARVLHQKAEQQDKKLEVVHDLVNSARTLLLRTNAEQARRIATQNPDDHDAQTAADRSEAELAQALKGQEQAPK